MGFLKLVANTVICKVSMTYNLNVVERVWTDLFGAHENWHQFWSKNPRERRLAA